MTDLSMACPPASHVFCPHLNSPCLWSQSPVVKLASVGFRRLCLVPVQPCSLRGFWTWSTAHLSGSSSGALWWATPCKHSLLDSLQPGPENLFFSAAYSSCVRSVINTNILLGLLAANMATVAGSCYSGGILPQFILGYELNGYPIFIETFHFETKIIEVSSSARGGQEYTVCAKMCFSLCCTCQTFKWITETELLVALDKKIREHFRMSPLGNMNTFIICNGDPGSGCQGISLKHKNLSLTVKLEVRGSPKYIRIHLLWTTNVWTRFHGDRARTSWDVVMMWTTDS